MASPRRPFRLSLTTQIVLGLGLGTLLGLFVGEPAGALRMVGTAFVGLLQMTVLPYMVCAIVSGIGALSLEQARRLAVRGGAIMLLLWFAPLFVVLTMAQGLPHMPSGAFYSTSFTEVPESVDFLKLYIPSNPFFSLANNLVPAVVLFSIVLGVTMITLPRKECLLEPLDTLATALSAVNKLVVKLTPIGVFGMAASAAGTMTADELGRLQAYFLLYIVSALLLALWVLPAVVSAFTPLRYRDLMAPARDAIVTAVVVDNVFVVLPQLISAVKRSLEDRGLGGEEAVFTAEVALPVAFTFPSSGRLLSLLFIPFSAWFLGHTLELEDYALLVGAGIPSNFGSAAIAMPFMLDLLRLPADMFQLFMVAGIVVGRFGTLVAVVHLLAITALTACAMTGNLHFRRRSATVAAVVTSAVIVLAILGSRQYLARQADPEFGRDAVVLGMQLLADPAPFEILDESAPNPDPLLDGESRLERSLRRGVLRVGFIPARLPFVFENSEGDLVGLDIELVHRLAHDLGVKLELVPCPREALESQLAIDAFDFAIGGTVYTLDTEGAFHFTNPYLHLTPGLVVPDHKRGKFQDLAKLRKNETLRVAARLDKYTTRILERILPRAQVVPINHALQYFEADPPIADALVASAEMGSAFTLIFAGYTVVPITETPIRWPMGFAVPSGDLAFAALLDDWIELKQGDGTLAAAYDHWILGKSAIEQKRRWSIMRNVLGWDD